jgi:hypothetical protein
MITKTRAVVATATTALLTTVAAAAIASTDPGSSAGSSAAVSRSAVATKMSPATPKPMRSYAALRSGRLAKASRSTVTSSEVLPPGGTRGIFLSLKGDDTMCLQLAKETDGFGGQACNDPTEGVGPILVQSVARTGASPVSRLYAAAPDGVTAVEITDARGTVREARVGNNTYSMVLPPVKSDAPALQHIDYVWADGSKTVAWPRS